MNWMPASTVIAYSLCAAMLLFACALRVRCGSWSNPSVVFALFWGIMTLMPVFFVPEIEPFVPALYFITANVIAFGIPAYLINWTVPLAAAASRRDGRAASTFLASREAFLLFFLVQAVVLGCMAANVAYQGFSVVDFLLEPYRVGCEYLAYRYDGSLKPFYAAQIATILNYISASFAGFLISARRSYLYCGLIVFFALLPSAYAVSAYGDKGTILLTIAFLYGSIVAGRIRQGQTSLLNMRTLLSVPLLIAGLATLIGLAMINRGGGACHNQEPSKIAQSFLESSLNLKSDGSGDGSESTASESSRLAFTVRSYAFGHLYAFSSWFHHYLTGGDLLPAHNEPNPDFHPQWNFDGQPPLYRNPDGLTYGFWTFMAIAKHMDPDYWSLVPDGYYDEYYVKRGVIQTNVYTYFRGLINDFGIYGSLLFSICFGFLLNITYRNQLLSIRSFASQALYVHYAGFLYSSAFISLLTWSSVIVSGVATFMMLVVIELIDRNGGALRAISIARLRRRRGSGGIR